MAAYDLIGGDSGLGGYDPSAGPSEPGGYTGKGSNIPNPIAPTNGGYSGFDPTPRTTYTGGGSPGSTNPGDVPFDPGQGNSPATLAAINASLNNAGAGVTPPQSGGTDLMARIQAQLASAKSSDDPNYWYQKISSDPNGAGSAWSYWADRINRGDGSQLGLQKFQDSPTAQTPASNSGFTGTGVFNDPATAQYEQYLNSLIGRFSQPYTPPSLQPALDYLGNYFQQLQGPAYTPQQMDLQKTQLFDPIMQQRDAARQQIIQRYSGRGISPDSGIVQKALQDSDMQFERLGTQAQAGVANNAIGIQKQQQAQAASLGPMIAQLEQGNYANQNANLLQGANLAGIIPQMAWSRLTGAQNGVTPINPMSLLTGLQQFQTQGYNQGANFGSGLMQILGQLFGGL